MARRDDLDSLFNEEEFSVDLDNEAVLKEKQARSEVLDNLPNFVILTGRILKFRKRSWAYSFQRIMPLLRNLLRFPCLGTVPRFLLLI